MLPVSSSDLGLPRAPRPRRLAVVGRIARHAWRQTRREGLADGLRVLFGAGRLVRGRAVLAELFAIPAFAQLMAAEPHADALFFISHRHFLSRDLGWRARLACVLSHYRFTQAHLAPALLQRLHGEGLPLWQHPGGYEIRLRNNTATRHEGPLSVTLRGHGRVLHELSFAWVDAEQLGPGAGRGPVLFATRSQSAPPTSAALARFRGDFPQNSPAFFALAALHALLQHLGQPRLIGVRDRAQIAYEPAHAAGFRHAYDDFWQHVGGRPLGAPGYEMPVPAAFTPLEQIKAKHRARARQRRDHWRQVNEAARQALSPYPRP